MPTLKITILKMTVLFFLLSILFCYGVFPHNGGLRINTSCKNSNLYKKDNLVLYLLEWQHCISTVFQYLHFHACIFNTVIFQHCHFPIAPFTKYGTFILRFRHFHNCGFLSWYFPFANNCCNLKERMDN